jgi:hypothetical protein
MVSPRCTSAYLGTSDSFTMRGSLPGHEIEPKCPLWENIPLARNSVPNTDTHIAFEGDTSAP